MLTLREAVAALAARLEEPVPEPDASGTLHFELADGLGLSLAPLGGTGRFVAWSPVVPAPAAAEAEAEAETFLRAHLGRVRDHPDVEAAVGDNGEFVLFVRAGPADAAAWLDTATELVNLTAAARRALSGGAGGKAGVSSLFSGMSGLISGR